MAQPPQDIHERMTVPARGAGGSPSGSALVGGTGEKLSAAEFGLRFEASSRALWCIAVGVTGDRARAEDLVQEAAMIALGKLDEFDAGTSFLAWMGQIVRFLALNDRRKSSREREARNNPVFQDAVRPERRMTDRIAPVSGRGGLANDQAVFDDSLAKAVMALEDTARSCLLLRTVMDLSYREIAQALTIPEGTAMSHVHRARHTLRKTLSAGRSGA